MRPYNLTEKMASAVQAMAKTAYTGNAHSRMLREAIPEEASKDVKGQMLRAVVGADTGIRRSELPFNDPVHAFPGSQSRKDVNKYIGNRIQFAAKNVAKGLSMGSGIRKEHLLAKGFGDYAVAQHTVMDRTAHRDKPKAKGVEAPIIRAATRALSKILPGYGGQVPTMIEHEHIRRGLKGAASIDRFSPKVEKIDKSALKDVKDTRQTFEAEVQQKLVDRHNMTPAEARVLAKNMYRQRIGKTGKMLGNLSRGAEHITTEVARAGKALRPFVLGGVHGGGVKGLVNPKPWMGM